MYSLRLALLSLMIVVHAAAATAQIVDPVVVGVIRDWQLRVVPGAQIVATNEESGVTRAARSDAQGRYQMPPVPAGQYTFRVELQGFKPIERLHQSLTVGAKTTIDFTFESVTADYVLSVLPGPALETTSHTPARLISRAEIDALPVVDRNFNGLATLGASVTPTGIYGGVDIGGGRDFQNAYNLDGVSAEGLSLGDQRLAYAQDWIQEFQVLTGQFAAEFGRASGGVLNAITRSGANRRSTRLYGYFRNDAWDARPYFATEKLTLRGSRWGATTGGRVREGLFYFAGLERLDHDTAVVVNTSFPSVNGSVPVTTGQTLMLGKMETYRGTNAIRMRVNADLKRNTNLGVGGILTEETGTAADWHGVDVVAAWNRELAGGFNELRTAYNTTESETTCNFAQSNPAGTWFGRRYPAAQFGCPNGFGWMGSGEWQAIDNMSWVRGGHALKAGATLSRGRNSGDFAQVRHGVYFFPTDTPFAFEQPDTYPIRFTTFLGPTAWDYPRWAWGVFLQGSWRVTRGLTLNGGVRYDVDYGYTALNDLIRTDRGLQTVTADLDNVAPRFGLAWTPVDGGQTVIRAGVGAFYDENHAEVSTLLLLNGILVDRSAFLTATTPSMNPFCPQGVPCTGAVLAEAVRQARLFLATSLNQNTVPDLSQLPGGAGVTPDLNPNLQVPFTIQLTAGVERAFRRGIVASADVIVARGHDQYTLRDVNIDRDAALLNNVIVRPNPVYTNINQYGNDGEYSYRALQLQAHYVPDSNRFVRVSYTLARNTGNTNTALRGLILDGIATNPFDLEEDRGPAYNDVRHSLSVSGLATLPWRIQVSGLLAARSALPWTVSTALPLDPDPFADRPEPRNSRRGDGYFSLDMRVAKLFSLGASRTAAMFAEVYNVTNAVNFSSYVGSLESSQFGQPSVAFDPRRVQLGFRIEF